jgi:hypothetical protein
VFNANPYVPAQTLMLDDAHTAEGFVANRSVRIRRGDRAFPAVLEVLAHVGAVSVDVIRRLRLDDTDDEDALAAVYLAGIAETTAVAGDLEQVLDDAAAQGDIPVESQFALDMIRESLSGHATAAHVVMPPAAARPQTGAGWLGCWRTRISLLLGGSASGSGKEGLGASLIPARKPRISAMSDACAVRCGEWRSSSARPGASRNGQSAQSRLGQVERALQGDLGAGLVAEDRYAGHV